MSERITGYERDHGPGSGLDRAEPATTPEEDFYNGTKAMPTVVEHRHW
jgi:hypothetical protein